MPRTPFSNASTNSQAPVPTTVQRLCLYIDALNDLYQNFSIIGALRFWKYDSSTPWLGIEHSKTLWNDLVRSSRSLSSYRHFSSIIFSQIDRINPGSDVSCLARGKLCKINNFITFQISFTWNICLGIFFGPIHPCKILLYIKSRSRNQDLN